MNESKLCIKCGTLQSVDNFYSKNVCKFCRRSYQREWVKRPYNIEKEKLRSKINREKYKDYMKDYQRDYYKNNKESIKKKNKLYDENNKEKRRQQKKDYFQIHKLDILK